jgi:hypothetical protein
MIADLTFDPDRHLYRFKGMPVPSVTQVLVGLRLIDDRYFTQAARDRGNAVHAAVQFWLEGDLDWSTVDPEIRPYVDAAILFLDDSHARNVTSERRVYHPSARYAGTLDADGEFFGDPGIVDWKSGAAGDTVGLQTSGYEMAVEQEVGLARGAYRRRFAVQLRKNGTYKAHDLSDVKARPEALRDRQRFLSAVDLFRTFAWKEAA